MVIFKVTFKAKMLVEFVQSCNSKKFKRKVFIAKTLNATLSERIN